MHTFLQLSGRFAPFVPSERTRSIADLKVPMRMLVYFTRPRLCLRWAISWAGGASAVLAVCTLCLLLGLTIPTSQAQSYNPNGVTVAGGNDQGSAANQLFNPQGIWVDAIGNLYVTDSYNQRVQKWAPGATSGTTVAGGKGNGIGNAANQFNFPLGVWVDAAGNVYVADNGNYRIQKWAPGASSGTTVAGGNGQGGAANQFYSVNDVAVDAAGNVYVADADNNRVQKWAPGANIGTTVASASTSVDQFFEPLGVFVDAAGNLYVADGSSSRILKFAPGGSPGVIVAGGNGRGGAANQLSNPTSVWVDVAGNIYVADQLNSRIQKWAPGASSGITVAGGHGNGSAANQFYGLSSVAVDASGNIYVSDALNNRVQRFSPLATTLSGLSASPNPVCVGSPISFTATVGNVTGAYNYTLTNGAGSAKQGTATALTFSQSLTATGSGTQSFTLTVADGGSIAKATTNLTVTTQTPDYQPLVDLYNNTGGANWANKTGWLSGCSPCGWYGVTCTNGRVTGLNLINNNLSGTLPTSLSALTSLQSLELGANALTGGIPLGISRLTALQTLNLSRTQLGGTIPPSLGQLTQLQNLLLNESALTGPLPASLGNLTQLQNLQLYANQLSSCFPGNYTALCGRSQISFTGNPGLPGGGDFAAFCSNGSGSELVIIQSPNSSTACVGSPFSFSFVARGAASYQWYKDGQRLAESGPVLSFASVSAADGGTYQAYINYACGTGAVQSDYFTLTARSDGPCARPDLTPVLYARPLVLSGNAAFGLVVEVIELNGVPTSGPITVYITKDPLVSLSFDPTATSLAGHSGAVQNAQWSFNGSADPSYYILTSSAVIGEQATLTFGLSGLLNAGGTQGQLSISTIVVGGSGGEVKINNNSDADKIDYFEK